MSSQLTLVSSNKCFGGSQRVYAHESTELKCTLNFAIFLPDNPQNEKLPVVYYLSGLTCSEANVIQKSGIQRSAAHHRVVLVCPDTSPRGTSIEGEHASYDLGSGAGFYVNATESKWATHYRMDAYVANELPKLIVDNFAVDGARQGITGHSMGGHGALTLALRNPGKYKSVSAFAPICNPIECPWGQKAFAAYLGEDKTAWAKYDATELVKAYDGPKLEIMIDQGTDDQFYKEHQLLPENFTAAAKNNSNVSVEFSLREGYDHSYFFIATFMDGHVEHLAKRL